MGSNKAITLLAQQIMSIMKIMKSCEANSSRPWSKVSFTGLDMMT